MLGTLVRLLPPAARAMGRLHLARRSESAPVHPMRRSWTVLNQNLLMSLDGLLLAKPVLGHGIVRGNSGGSAGGACRPGLARAMITAYPRSLHKCIKAVHGAAHLGEATIGYAPRNNFC